MRNRCSLHHTRNYCREPTANPSNKNAHKSAILHAKPHSPTPNPATTRHPPTPKSKNNYELNKQNMLCDFVIASATALQIRSLAQPAYFNVTKSSSKFKPLEIIANLVMNVR